MPHEHVHSALWTQRTLTHPRMCAMAAQNAAPPSASAVGRGAQAQRPHTTAPRSVNRQPMELSAPGFPMEYPDGTVCYPPNSHDPHPRRAPVGGHKAAGVTASPAPAGTRKAADDTPYPSPAPPKEGNGASQDLAQYAINSIREMTQGATSAIQLLGGTRVQYLPQDGQGVPRYAVFQGEGAPPGVYALEGGEPGGRHRGCSTGSSTASDGSSYVSYSSGDYDSDSTGSFSSYSGSSADSDDGYTTASSYYSD